MPSECPFLFYFLAWKFLIFSNWASQRWGVTDVDVTWLLKVVLSCHSQIPLPCTVISPPHLKILGDSLLCCWHELRVQACCPRNRNHFLFVGAAMATLGNLHEEHAVALKAKLSLPLISFEVCRQRGRQPGLVSPSLEPCHHWPSVLTLFLWHFIQD